MKKLIFAIVVILVSVVVFTSCTEERILTELEDKEKPEGGGSSHSDPDLEE